jgi:lysophospholipase L1-like esterase
MRRLVALLAASLLTVAIATPAFAAPGKSGDHAVMYYLSLGDSLAAGVQPIGDPNAAYRTADGYTDQLYQMALAKYPKLRHVKLGCPGATTTSFIEGDPYCPYPHGSQLDEAVAFLHAHHTFVAFVTIDIGWNDFPCQDAVSCMPAGLASIGTNLPTILDALRDAAGPDVPIVGMNLYDPFLAYWLVGRQDLAYLSVQAFTTPPDGINPFVESVYQGRQVPVADVETALHTTEFVPLVGLPGYPVPVPLNVFIICTHTWVCGPANDQHANHDGYHLMAEAFRVQLGL